jgi:hypothetical protein
LQTNDLRSRTRLNHEISATTATLTVSDWQYPNQPTPPFGQEQTFNFLEIQPYHE